MEVAEGYKDTKIGRIPKDWEVVKLGDVVKYSQGVQVDLDLQKYEPFEGYIKFLRIENYTQNSQDFRFIPIPSKKDKIISKDDVVVVRYGATAGTVGRGFDGVLANNLFKVIPNEKLDNGFLFRYLSSLYSYLQSLMSGGAMPALNFGMLNLLYTPLPHLSEQQKIAEILSTVDEQISTTQSIIDKSKELKKGLMQKLFSEGIGHTEFKDTKIGRIPKDWEVGKLGDNCIKATKKFEPSQSNDSHKYIGLEHIISNAHNINGYGDSNDTSSTKTIFKKGEILYGKLRPYLNKVWRAKFNGVCTTEILVLKSKNDFENGFLFYLLHSHRFIAHTISNTEGTSLPRANWKDIAIFKLPIPPLAEQQKIADILSEADAKIEKEEQEKAKLEELKKGLMQQLLTGTKRVKV
jgi:type I restriction enzyme, S subunit